MNVRRVALVASLCGLAFAASSAQTAPVVSKTGARELLVLNIGDSITPGFSFRTDSALALTANGKSLVAVKCGTGVVFLRNYKGSSNNPGNSQRSADSVAVIVTCPAPAPAPTPTPTPTPTGSTDAALPQVFLTTTVASTPSNGRTLRIAAGGNFQAALDSALPGDRILVAHGATFVGNFGLNPKATGTACSAGWVTVQSDGAIPAEGTRVSPAIAAADSFPRLMSIGVNPVLATNPSASCWRFTGIEFTNDTTQSVVNGTVLLGDASIAQNAVGLIPHHIILDRVYVHGNAKLDDRRCVTFNGASLAAVESYISDCHSAFDAQAIAGTDGPGPFKIVDNYLEASGENVAWGGASPVINGLIPSDIEIRHNHFYKPMSWVNGPWLVKNSYESKNSNRVLIDGNVFENNWPNGQNGHTIVLWSADQQANAPWSMTANVTFTNNIIKNVTAGWALTEVAGAPFGGTPMNHITIRNNVLIGPDLLAATAGGGARTFDISGIIRALTIEHNTAFTPDADIVWGGEGPMPDLTIRNNMIGGGLYHLFTNAGQAALGWAAMADSASVFVGNVVPFMSNWLNVIPGNFEPISLDSLGLVGGGAAAMSVTAAPTDLALSASSPYKGKGTDGTDPGANIPAILAAVVNVVQAHGN